MGGCPIVQLFQVADVAANGTGACGRNGPVVKDRLALRPFPHKPSMRSSTLTAAAIVHVREDSRPLPTAPSPTGAGRGRPAPIFNHEGKTSHHRIDHHQFEALARTICEPSAVSGARLQPARGSSRQPRATASLGRSTQKINPQTAKDRIDPVRKAPPQYRIPPS